MKPEDSEATRTEVTRAASSPPDTGEPVTLRLPSRYALGPRLGRGGFGAVFAARDKLVGRDVAVKVLAAHRASAILERETGALRLLDLPGVVKLLDSGASDGAPWFVMERIEGTHFPDGDRPVPWESLQPTVLELLRALARIHRAGFVHGDIKPSNVLVQPNRVPVILDLGLARSRDAGTAAAHGGTPLYMAPEQLSGGSAVAASDVYAVGLMLWRALTGQWPHGDLSPGEGVMARMHRDFPPLSESGVSVPPAVAALVADMLQRVAKQRPSALACVERLVPRDAASLLDPPPRSVDELATFFTGRERLFHIPSMSAKILWDRSGGDIGRMRRTLQAWLMLGVATRTEAGVGLPIDTLERLHAGWAPENEVAEGGTGAIPGSALAKLLSLTSGDDTSVAATALHLASQERERGNLRGAAVCLREGLRACWRTQEFAIEGALVTRVTEVALEDRSVGALDEAIDLIGRGRIHGGRELELLRAARALLDGRSDVAMAILEEARPSDPFELQRARHDLRVQVAVNGPLDSGSLSELERELEQWTSTSPSDERPFLHRWRSRLLYRQGRMKESGQEAESAAGSAITPFDEANALLQAAAAWIETAEVSRTTTIAQKAKLLASKLWAPRHEARAEWFSRSLLNRAGAAPDPDFELVQAARELGSPHLEGLITVTEAAIAWRSGNDSARSLASAAAAVFSLANYREAGLFARALEIACGAGGTDDARELATQACAARRPDIAVEVLGLLALSGMLRGDWRSAFEEQAVQLRSQDPHWRAGALSLHDARSAVESVACST